MDVQLASLPWPLVSLWAPPSDIAESSFKHLEEDLGKMFEEIGKNRKEVGVALVVGLVIRGRGPL
jgi:hypothetical protein